MSIVKEKYDGLSMNTTREKREYSCTYICRGVTSTSEFPSYFRWECKGMSDPFARLVGIGDTRQIGPDMFEVTAQYSTSPADQREKQADKDPVENPLARPVRRRWSTGSMEHYPPADLSTPPKAFSMSTGEPIRGGIPVKIPYIVKHYIRNEAYFDEDDCLTKIWTTDSTRKILCARYDGSETYEDNGISFVEVTYEFWKLGGSRTWDELRLDAGSYWMEGTGENRKPKYLEDAAGVKAFADGAIMLDGAGGRLSQEDIAAGNFHWNTFRVFGVANFSSFGLSGL